MDLNTSQDLQRLRLGQIPPRRRAPIVKSRRPRRHRRLRCLPSQLGLATSGPVLQWTSSSLFAALIDRRRCYRGARVTGVEAHGRERGPGGSGAQRKSTVALWVPRVHGGDHDMNHLPTVEPDLDPAGDYGASSLVKPKVEKTISLTSRRWRRR